MTTYAGLVSAFGTDLTTAGVVGAAGRVYGGRRPRDKSSTALEVWVQLEDRVDEGTGAQDVKVWSFLLHLRGGPTNAGSSGAGAAQVSAVEVAALAVEARYHSELPAGISSALTGTLCFCSAQLEELDEDEEEDRQSATVRVEIGEAS